MSKVVTKSVESQEAQTKRIASIDRFRGIAIFCMIVFQLLSNFNSVGIFGQFSKHFSAGETGNGILIFANTNLADLIAPMFMFAIAMTFIMSYRRRVKLYGKTKTNFHFVVRNLMIIGIGALLSGINHYVINMEFTRTIDYVFAGLAAVSLIFILLSIIFSIKPIKKHRRIFTTGATYSLAVFGLVTAVVMLIAYIGHAANITTLHMNYWMVLQSLGMAGLIALPFMSLNFTWRAVGTGLLFVAFACFYHFLGGFGAVDAFTQGGFMGSFGWAFIVLAGSLFSEMFFKKRQYGYYVALAITLIAIAMYFLVPIIKVGGVKPDPTYLIVTAAISMIVFIIVDLFSFYTCKFDPLAWWGRYPLLMYLMEFGIIGLFTTFAPDSVVADAPLWLAIVITAAFVTLFTTIVYFLNKKNKRISL